MYIDKLENIIMPNNELLIKYTEKDWNEVELKLGGELPTDYKKFINKYGSGSINNFLWILNPFTENNYLNLIEQGNKIRKSYLTLKNEFPEDFKHDVFPNKGGLLPCAITDNGNQIYWLTSCESNKWSIMVYESRAAEYYEYNMGLAEFLYKILIREIECLAFPDDFPGDKCEFKSVMKRK